MKYSSIMHGASIVAAIFGALSLIGAWIAEVTDTVFGLSQTHLFNDAIVLELIGIAAGICALYRRQLDLEVR